MYINDMDKKLKDFFEAIGISPINVEIIRPNGSSDMSENKQVNNESGRDIAQYLSGCGFTSKRIEELMREIEQNKKAAEESKKASDVKNSDSVFMAMHAIAGAYGYQLKRAVIKDGEPSVSIIEPDLSPKVAFTKSAGFIVLMESVADTEIRGNQVEGYIQNMSDAYRMCKALNKFDWKSWPRI